MRLGGPIFEKCDGPDAWAQAVARAGYRAAFCPVGLDQDEATAMAYAAAARQADIVIAEVGAWSNPLSPDEGVRSQALEYNKASLLLAEKIGARCCVNIAGSRGAKWDGPSPLDLTEETFERIVANVREIIDSVRPRRAFYSLETMPWMYPDSTESYLRLVKAIDRPAFGVHFDPVNLVCSPQRYFNNAFLVREFVAQLGKWIKSVHLKDIILRDQLTTHLDEVRPGLGGLDYGALLTALAPLGPDLPVMLEHLPSAEEYVQAAEAVRGAAARAGVSL
jgi:sugar phosphate isomerase/epimerase